MGTRKSRIYTKTGDSGKTSLFSGERVSKDSQRVVAYGTIDELNAAIGLSVGFIKKSKVANILQEIQKDLFTIGANLANPQKKANTTKNILLIEEPKVEYLENIIDQYDSNLKPLRNFILPGGTRAASSLHLARAISRRAEREIVRLSKVEKVDQNILTYLNRLSDLLFVLARHLNQKEKMKETVWKS